MIITIFIYRFNIHYFIFNFNAFNTIKIGIQNNRFACKRLPFNDKDGLRATSYFYAYFGRVMQSAAAGQE